MKIIDGILFLEFNEAVDSGISESSISKASYRNSPSWHIIDDPDDKRKILIGYEKLSPHNKEKISNRFGSPYDYMAKQPIRRMMIMDIEAELFYRKYRYDVDKILPIDHQ